VTSPTRTKVAALVDRTVDTFGRLDLAFNNAGIMLPRTDAADEPAAAFDRVNGINLAPHHLDPRRRSHGAQEMRSPSSGSEPGDPLVLSVRGR
jgi:NAD(P)-dependent dehydrogenase (short-subunit alcohol dehydrogenase family)